MQFQDCCYKSIKFTADHIVHNKLTYRDTIMNLVPSTSAKPLNFLPFPRATESKWAVRNSLTSPHAEEMRKVTLIWWMRFGTTITWGVAIPLDSFIDVVDEFNGGTQISPRHNNNQARLKDIIRHRSFLRQYLRLLDIFINKIALIPSRVLMPPHHSGHQLV